MSKCHENANAETGLHRRDLLCSGLAVSSLATLPGIAHASFLQRRANPGWEADPMRWLHLVFADDDPGRYDLKLWIKFFRNARIEGAVLSAGGFSAYYPTKVPLHMRSPFLGKHDMFGEMVKACSDLGIRVLARIDPHALWPAAAAARPDWVMRDEKGAPRPHSADPKMTLACLNGGVAYEFLPAIHREVLERYPVDGIFGNRWAGNGLCFCQTCRTKFRQAKGMELPASLAPDKTDEGVRQAYLHWDDDMRFEQLKLWNSQIEAINPAAFYTPGTFGRLDPVRLRSVVRAAYADRQARPATSPAYANGESAKETRAVMRDKPIAGIFAVGQTATPYRLMDSTATLAELRAYLHDGLAQGFRPSVCKFKAEVFDKRWIPVIERAFQWHARHEPYFRNSANLARVALVQSERTLAVYDKAEAWAYGFSAGSRNYYDSRAGWYQALVEARIPFEIVDDRDMAPEVVDRFDLLILGNVAAMSDVQCAQIRRYVAQGGSIVATNETSLYDETGKQRGNFGLADVLGCDFAGKVERGVKNSYLALNGPHPLLKGLEDTPRIINGAQIVHVRPTRASERPLSLIPSYPDLPMERLFPPAGAQGGSMAFLNRIGSSRTVYFANDIDRMFRELSALDHLKIMTNAVDWAAPSARGLVVEGPGLFDVSFWRQSNSITAHLVNLTNPMAMRGAFHENIPVGPLNVRLKLPFGERVAKVRLLEGDREIAVTRQGDELRLTIPSVEVHEVIAVDLA